MSDSSQPPVEPMSDLSWARVERGLWARLDGPATAPVPTARKRRWLWIVLPSAIAATAAAATFAFVVDSPTAPPAAPAVAVEDTPTRVVSGSAPSSITFGDAHVTLDAESAVVMSPRAATTTAVLERGGAWFAIAPRSDHAFVVVAGDTVVRVVGTRFHVARFEEHASVAVDRGVVDITYRGTMHQIGAGQSWSSQPPVTAPAPLPVPAIIKAAPKSEPAIDRDRLAYERAAALETKDPSAALTGYLELARGSGRWSEIAQFAAARLASDRGDPRTHALLDEYLRRFPRGANADDARQLLDRLKGVP